MGDNEPLALLFHLLMFFCCLLGAIDLFVNVESNQCEMTYMFEYFEYPPITLPADVPRRYPHYSLHTYVEGAQFDQVQKGTFYTGVPVLFIPGNAGSHKQVRSLGSVSYQMARKLKLPFHLTYFAVDFDEQLSGLFGPLLDEQTDFVAHCVRRIWHIYAQQKANANRSHQMIVVGHSMGGVIATALLSRLEPELRSRIAVVVLQASPIRQPVAVLDPHMARFYERLLPPDRLGNGVTLLSVGGGFRDHLVPSRFTLLPKAAPANWIHTLTMALPFGWVSTDHLCIVWCRQLVKQTVRSLLYSVDSGSGALSTSAELRERVLQHFFKTNPGSETFVDAKQPPAVTPPRLTERAAVGRERDSSWSADALREPLAVVVSTPADRSRVTHLLVDSSVLGSTWLLACPPADDLAAPNRSCSSISHLAQPLPPLYADRRLALLEVAHLPPFARDALLVVYQRRRPPAATFARVKHFNLADSSHSAELALWPTFLASFRAFPASLFYLQHYTIEPRAGLFRVRLPGFSSHLLALQASLFCLQCDRPAADVTRSVSGQTVHVHSSVVRFVVPGSAEDTFRVAPFNGSAVLPLKLQLGAPSSLAAPELWVYPHPDCRFNLVLTVSLQESLGQFFRYYAIHLLPYLFLNVLVAACLQMRSCHDNAGVCHVSFHMALFDAGVFCGHFLVGWAVLAAVVALRCCGIIQDNSWLGGVFPEISLFYYGADTSGSYPWATMLLVPPMLQSFAFTMLFVCSYAYIFVLNIMAATVGSVLRWLSQRRSSGGLLVLMGLGLASGSVALGSLHCGVVCLLGAYVVNVGALLVAIRHSQKHFTVFTFLNSTACCDFAHLLLLLGVAGLCFPALATWLRHAAHGYSLTADPTLVSCAIVGLFWVVRCALLAARVELRYSLRYRLLLNALALVIPISGCRLFYRIHQLVALGYVAATVEAVLQLVAAIRSRGLHPSPVPTPSDTKPKLD